MNSSTASSSLLARWLQAGVLLCSFLALAACGPSATGKVPVDHPIYEHKAPEEEEPDLADEEEDEEDGEGDDDATEEG